MNNLFVNRCTVLNEDYQVLLTVYALKFNLDLFLQWHSYVSWHLGCVITVATHNSTYDLKKITTGYWICFYLARYFKIVCLQNVIVFFHLKHLFCCSLGCMPPRVDIPLAPHPQLCPWVLMLKCIITKQSTSCFDFVNVCCKCSNRIILICHKLL